MAVIELMRKSHARRSAGPLSDLRVYPTNETGSKKRSSIGLRVSESVMKRLRWLVGDYVTAAFDDAAMTWTIRRVADQKGNRLSSQGKKEGCGTVRFRVDSQDLRTFGLGDGQGYDCSLASCDNESAVFRID